MRISFADIQFNQRRSITMRASRIWYPCGIAIKASKMNNRMTAVISALAADELILDSRVTDASGLIMLLRREPSSSYDEKPAFGIRGESGMLRDGLWWQREEYARAAFAAAS